MNLLQGGAPLADIGNLLRHGSAETTQVYLHADLRIREKAMEKTRPVGVEPGRFKPDNSFLASCNRRDYAGNSCEKARGFNDPGRKHGIIRLSTCHAIFNSLGECIAAIEDYIGQHNADDARTFRGSKTPEILVEAWRKGHQKLQESAS